MNLQEVNNDLYFYRLKTAFLKYVKSKISHISKKKISQISKSKFERLSHDPEQSQGKLDKATNTMMKEFN